MIPRLRALGRDLEFDRRDTATAFRAAEASTKRHVGSRRNHRPDKPKFTGHRRHPGGILSDIKQSNPEPDYNWIVVGPQTRPANGHGRYDEKDTGFGR
jgi:hypothetical protein